MFIFLRKFSFRASYFLFILIVFHLVGNIVWIKLNNSPPAWDEANHTKISFEFLNFFRGIFFGRLDFKDFIQPFSDNYGPLVRLFTGLIMFIFGENIKLAQFTGTIFFLLTLIMIYFLGKEIFKNDWIGLIAAFIFSFYQALYNYSRWLLLDVPLIFFLLITIYFLIKSNFFQDRKYTLLTFICLSLTILIKLQGIIYLIIPFGYFLIFSVKKYNLKYKYIKNLVLGITISILFILPWIIFSFKNVINYYLVAVKPEPFVDPHNLIDPTTWLHYLKLFINYEITLFIFLVFLLCLYFYLKTKSNFKFFILINVVFYYLWFTIFPNKDMRYLFPILPFTAFIFAKGFFEFYQRKQILANFILSLIICFNIVTYLVLSFEVIFPKGLRKQIDLPYVRDIIYLNLTDYPVKKFDSKYWPNEKIISDLSKIDKNQKKILLTIDYEKINNNNLTFLIYKNNIKNVEFVYPFNIVEFKEIQIPIYVKQFDYVLVSEVDINPFYLFNKKALNQLRSFILLNNDKFQLTKTYRLPTGENIYLFKIKKIDRNNSLFF